MKNKYEPMFQLKYSQIISSLMYIANCTRSDIAFVVNKLSRFTSNLSHHHWEVLNRVLRYLKHALTFGLHFTKYHAILKGYCDANWISNMNDFKPTSGHVFTIGGATVPWKSRKQTMESKFIPLDNSSEEAEWLLNSLEALNIGLSRYL